MALGSTQPLTEMSTRDLGGKRLQRHKADKLTAICEPIIWRKYEGFNISQLYGPLRPVTGITLPFLPLTIA
jgi:hypothetical protein